MTATTKKTKANTEEFQQRLLRHQDELKWLFMEIYNNEGAYNNLVEMMKSAYIKRDESLKELDRSRVADPSWYKGNDMLGDLMYTDCFNKTLKGVREKLDYLRETGVNYVHLMPLLESPVGRNDGGYAVSDFRKVDPKLGTMKDLKDLSDSCHKLGMSVCLDFVMNHTSEDHIWAKKAREGIKEYQDMYFFYDNWDIPNQFERTVPQVFPQTAPGNFSWCPAVNKVVMTTFYPYQWDLNYENPVVFTEMTDNMLFLCNHGVDIIRLDAVPYIWKQLGTSCRNLPRVHTLVRMMRMICEIVCPGTLLLGEVVMEPKEVVPYFGTVDKPECHMLYNVTTMATTWHTVATGDVRLLKHQMEAVFSLPNEYTFLNYLRCHDDIGWGLEYKFLSQFGVDEVSHKKFLNDYLTGRLGGSISKGELYNSDPKLGDARLVGMTASFTGLEKAIADNDQDAISRAIRYDLMLHAFLLTQSGIPVLYSGDEIGQTNDYSYHDDVLKADDSRYLHRGAFQWNLAEQRGDLSSVTGRIYSGLKTLVNLRKQYSLFDSSADVWVVETYNDHILGIGRYLNGQKLVGLFNFSWKDEDAHIGRNEPYINLLTGQKVPQGDVWIPSHDFVWLFHDFNNAD